MNFSVVPVALLLSAAAINSANAQVLAPIRIIETSIETTTLGVSLPASVPARFVARSCDTCPAATLSLTEESRFFVGRDEMRYAQFLAASRSRSRFMTIHYTPETLDVTRIVVSTAP